MLGHGVAEVRGPGPAFPIRPGRSRVSLERVERSAVQVSGRHLSYPSDLMNLFKRARIYIAPGLRLASHTEQISRAEDQAGSR
jgi:hypothetical protein